MQTIAVFVNDASHASQVLAPVLASALPTRWILVACAPRLTRHAGRWVSRTARQQWHERWAADVCAPLEAQLRAQAGQRVERMLAKQPLIELVERLSTTWDGLRMLDARQPRLGQTPQPLTASEPPAAPSAWVAPLAVTTGLSAMLAMAD